MDKIYFAKIHPEAKIPTKREEDAGRDIYACFDEEYMFIPKGTVTLVPTGIASAFSPDYYIQLEERGSTGTKSMIQHCGVIDSGFRNEWKVPIGNYIDKDMVIIKKDSSAYFFDVVEYPYEKAICQAVVHDVPKLIEEEVSYENLLKFESERGLGMLGSSGK